MKYYLKVTFSTEDDFLHIVWYIPAIVTTNDVVNFALSEDVEPCKTEEEALLNADDLHKGYTEQQIVLHMTSLWGDFASFKYSAKPSKQIIYTYTLHDDTGTRMELK